MQCFHFQILKQTKVMIWKLLSMQIDWTCCLWNKLLIPLTTYLCTFFKRAAPVVSDFEIPTLPSGQQLIVNILSTWGDKHYVGLNGIEIFTSNGNQPSILDVSILRCINFVIEDCIIKRFYENNCNLMNNFCRYQLIQLI